MLRIVTTFCFIILASSVISGCSNKSEGTNGAQVESPAPAKTSVIVVPDEVKGRWKAVKIALTDKSSKKESVFTVAIGSQFSFPETNLSVSVDNFLPDFTMNGTVMTSQSNEPKNPAARVRIYEDDKEIFKGWLFSLYPTTHAIQHPKFGFTLVGFVPAG